MARSTVKEVTLIQVETVAHQLARELMEGDEPIPAFETRYPDRLESCIRTPFQKFGGQSLYRGLIGKGGMLFYLMIKNHPFQNGNKRVAVMTLFYFLFKNTQWLDVSDDQLYEFAVQVATSNPKDKDKILKDIRAFMRKHLIPYKDPEE